MGADLEERRACAERIEELEAAGRKDAGVYHHNILALPAELSAEGRAELLANLCAHLERLRLPFTAVLHKPDPSGNQNNYHAHILVSLRPMIKTETHFEFECSKRTWLNTPAGLKLQRRVIAKAFNDALARENISTRWTHRSRAADGLVPPGNTKRGAPLARAEAAENQVVCALGVEQLFASKMEVAIQTLDLVDEALEMLVTASSQLDAFLNRQIGAATRELGSLDAQRAALTGLSEQLGALERASQAQGMDGRGRGHPAAYQAEARPEDSICDGSDITSNRASEDQEAQSRREREELFRRRHAKPLKKESVLAANEVTGAEGNSNRATSSTSAGIANDAIADPKTEADSSASPDGEFTQDDLEVHKAFLASRGLAR